MTKPDLNAAAAIQHAEHRARLMDDFARKAVNEAHRIIAGLANRPPTPDFTPKQERARALIAARTLYTEAGAAYRKAAELVSKRDEFRPGTIAPLHHAALALADALYDAASTQQGSE